MHMEALVRINNITQYNQIRSVETLHPLITVVNVEHARQLDAGRYEFNLYSVYLKKLDCGALVYGRSNYDYHDGTVVALAPGRIIEIPPEAIVAEPKGWALLFHPDLLPGTILENPISAYSFLAYEISEALHVSNHEASIVAGCFHKILYELSQSLDKHSKKLIAANIELLLSYCSRFYDRQFISRDYVNSGIMDKFDSYLDSYFESEYPGNLGLPTVSHCAAELRFSSNYFGDLVKKETGKSAQELIHAKIINLAKSRLRHLEIPIAEVAYGLGFKYPQHFTRLFRERMGMTPFEYRLHVHSKN